MFKTLKHFNIVPIVVGLGLSLSSINVIAQEGKAAAPVKPTGPIICPGYKRGRTNLVGQSVGKKVQKAFEAYNEDLMDEAVRILEEINSKDEFDTAYVNRFLGNILAGMEGQGNKALGYLTSAAQKKVLNDGEHAELLKLVADLSMQEQKYRQAIDYYNRWMDFTCKENPDVYTRMTQAYYESKMFPEMIEPADKAIALYEKPNKNPFVLKLSSYYERKMFKESVSVAEQLVLNFPEDPKWWTQLGLFYLSVENYDYALSTFEIAYNNGYLTKKSEATTFSQLYGIKGIPHKAAKIQKEFMDAGLIERDAKNLATLANSYHQAKDFRKAAKTYGEAGDLSSDPVHFEKQGNLLLIAGNYKGAIKAFEKALDRGAEDVGGIHYSLMEANFYNGDFKQAYVHVKEAKKDRKIRRNANAWIPYIETKAKNRGVKL